MWTTQEFLTSLSTPGSPASVAFFVISKEHYWVWTCLNPCDHTSWKGFVSSVDWYSRQVTALPPSFSSPLLPASHPPPPCLPSHVWKPCFHFNLHLLCSCSLKASADQSIVQRRVRRRCEEAYLLICIMSSEMSCLNFIWLALLILGKFKRTFRAQKEKYGTWNAIIKLVDSLQGHNVRHFAYYALCTNVT